MNKRAFVFTMDAILALIPIFIILATISQLSSEPILRMQGSALGEERIAQDVLATLDRLNLIDSTNTTAINQTLQRLIPDYLHYEYTSATFTRDRFTLSSGNISQAEDIVVAKRIGTISTGYVAIATPNIFAKTVDPGKIEARVVNAVLYSLVGINTIDITPVSSSDATSSQWKSIGRVTATLQNVSTWAGTNNTLYYLVDRLIEEASSQGEGQAVTGLNRLKARLQEMVTENTSAGHLRYNVNDILNADLGDSEIASMKVSASEVILTAFQSANAGRGTINPTYTSMTSLLSKRKKNKKFGRGKKYDYFMNLSIKILQPTQISAVSVGKTFYASKAEVNLSVYEVYRDTGNVKRNANISYSVTSRPSFNITNIYQQGANIRIDRFHSIAFDVDGYGEISATVYYTSTTTAVFEQRERDFRLIPFTGTPQQRDDNRVFTKESGDLNQGKNYQDARKIARDGGMEKVFELLLFDRQGDRKRAYGSISDAKLVSKETLVVLKLWEK